MDHKNPPANIHSHIRPDRILIKPQLKIDMIAFGPQFILKAKKHPSVSLVESAGK